MMRGGDNVFKSVKKLTIVACYLMFFVSCVCIFDVVSSINYIIM